MATVNNRPYEKIGQPDEPPFEIPDSWEWACLPQIAKFDLGKTPERHSKKYWANGIYPWFSISDMSDKKTINVSKEKITMEALCDKFDGTLIPQGTLLMSFKLTIGRTSILGVDAVHNEAIISIVPYISTDNITRNFLMYVLGTLVNYTKYTDAVKGATLNSNKLNLLQIPLPPLAEQKRIVARIEELFAQIEIIDNNQAAIEELYDELKKRTLELAIQGKLVPQDPADEPASVLLERIRAEKKAKLGKKYVESYIYKGDDNCYYEKIGKNEPVLLENLPFEIPDNWFWVRLDNVVEINPKNHIDDNLTVSFVEMKAIKDGFENDFTYEIRTWKNIKAGFTHFKENDVGFAKITPCFQNRKSVIFQGLNNGYGAGTTELHILRPYKNTIISDYLLWFVKSHYLIEYGKSKFSGTAGQQRYGTEEVRKTLIPIPPQSEQIRICLQISRIFNFIDKGTV